MRRDGHHGSSVSHSVPVPRCAEPVAASSKIMLLDLATEIAGAAGSALADHGPATARFPRSRPTPATCLTQLQPPEDSSPLKIGRVSGCAEGDLASPQSTTGQKSAALRLGSLGRSSNLRTHAICTCMGHHIRDNYGHNSTATALRSQHYVHNTTVTTLPQPFGHNTAVTTLRSQLYGQNARVTTLRSKLGSQHSGHNSTVTTLRSKR